MLSSAEQWTHNLRAVHVHELEAAVSSITSSGGGVTVDGNYVRLVGYTRCAVCIARRIAVHDGVGCSPHGGVHGESVSIGMGNCSMHLGTVSLHGEMVLCMGEMTACIGGMTACMGK